MNAFTDMITRESTGEHGVDENGEFEMFRVYGEEHCRCHPETCCHFDGLRDVDYVEKVYKKS